MSRVQEEVESHYRSGLVERIRGQGGVLQQGRNGHPIGQAIRILLRGRTGH